MRRLTKLVGAGVVVALTGMQARAGAFTENYYWLLGDAAGQHAGSCTIYYPDERPLTVPRTLVVDKNTPDGTVLFQWNYGEFLSDTTLHCVSSGITNSTSSLNSGNPNSVYFFSNYAPYSGIHGLITSDTGIQLKILVRYNTACGFVGSFRYYSTGFGDQMCPAAGSVFDTRTSSNISGYLAQIMQPYYSEGRWTLPTAAGSISLAAALIKQGTISYPSALSIGGPNPFYLRMGAGGGGYTVIQDYLTGSAIQIVPPACRLRTTDYNIAMGRWTADIINYVGLPAYGTQVPVNLSLECSGSVNHVRFRFEDTGSSLSANRNISLYDTAGGTKIEGLEIELLHNGTKVNVDNTTLTDTGSHGAAKPSPAVLPVFNSASTASFQARYVQSSAVTRSGANYTGPVTGKVNMYVTYD